MRRDRHGVWPFDCRYFHPDSSCIFLWHISAGADVHVVLVGCLTFCLLTRCCSFHGGFCSWSRSWCLHACLASIAWCSQRPCPILDDMLYQIMFCQSAYRMECGADEIVAVLHCSSLSAAPWLPRMVFLDVLEVWCKASLACWGEANRDLSGWEAKWQYCSEFLITAMGFAGLTRQTSSPWQIPSKLRSSLGATGRNHGGHAFPHCMCMHAGRCSSCKSSVGRQGYASFLDVHSSMSGGLGPTLMFPQCDLIDASRGVSSSLQ